MAHSLRQIWTSLGIPADYAKTRHLPLQREARRLVRIGHDSQGRFIRLAPRTALAWKRMQATAAAQGITLVLLSGFRSIARQRKIIRQKLSRGTPLEHILRFVAAPGCSEHHTGCALDLGSPQNQHLTETFARTLEYRWLKKHAATFGFHLSYPRRNVHGISYEPWHWCWRAPAKR